MKVDYKMQYSPFTDTLLPWALIFRWILPRLSVWSIPQRRGTCFSHRLWTFMSHAEKHHKNISAKLCHINTDERFCKILHHYTMCLIALSKEHINLFFIILGMPTDSISHIYFELLLSCHWSTNEQIWDALSRWLNHPLKALELTRLPSFRKCC